ncbi:hypothetical protein MMC18_002499 [Xylographa bjoerkii]|nr:hypothetical protein [Xylographa bjoerkii]
MEKKEAGQGPAVVNGDSEIRTNGEDIHGTLQDAASFSDTKLQPSPGKSKRKQKMTDMLVGLQDLIDKIANLADGEDDEDNKDSVVCTAENWKTFMPCRQWDENAGKYTEVCVPNDDPESKTPVLLTKSATGSLQFEIHSTYLQKEFRRIVDIQKYYQVTLLASCIIVREPYVPLYHHLEEMKASISNNPDASKADRNSFMAMYYLCELGWLRRQFQDVRNVILEGFIIYNDIWALYRPNDYVVSLDPVGSYTIAQIASVKLEDDILTDIRRDRWFITTEHISWSEGKYRKVSRKRRLESFEGAKKIDELACYPLSYYAHKEKLMKDALHRGKEWRQYCEGVPKVMSYHGQGLLMTGDSWGRLSNDAYALPEYNTVALACSVIVDSDARSKAIKQCQINSQPFLEHPDFRSRDSINRADYSSCQFTEDDYLQCPASVTVFNLDDHEWYSVDTLHLKEKNWRPAVFDRLVVDTDTKDRLRRLAKANAQKEMESSRDVIEGKGKGTVLLLHGPSGVGKTMTAEVLSELTKKPLLKVNLGRISTHINWEQSLEQIFYNAESWKGILLIDEAEIVLEKRTFERMAQNSWISVFLRKLEYYKGILILTTNLIDCIDSAFESRISYPVQFPELSKDDRRQIWKGFIENMNMLTAYKRSLLEWVDKWAAAEINGRQIRNIISMAEDLASSDEQHPRLKPEHVEEILNVTLEFSRYNKSNVARVKKDYFAY